MDSQSDKDYEALQDRCRKLLHIAGACLSGTDEVERIVASHPSQFDCGTEAMRLHRERQDATLNAMREAWESARRSARAEPMNALRELVACKDMKDELDRVEIKNNALPRNYYAEGLREKYEARKSLAWESARKVVASDGGAKATPEDFGFGASFPGKVRGG